MKKELKIGDRVSYWGYNDLAFLYCGDIGVIEKTLPEGCFVVKIIASGKLYSFHSKQLRKLKKKESRVWWVNTKHKNFSTYFEYKNGLMIRTTKPENTDGYICLKEVKVKK